EMMLRQGGGKIVNIASASADVGGRGQTNYAAAKGGLVAFSRAGAGELARKGIRMNAVLPGIIETDMSLPVRQRASTKLLERIPARRFGRAEEVADLVSFLVSDASDYVVGQAIAIDGGLSASCGDRALLPHRPHRGVGGRQAHPRREERRDDRGLPPVSLSPKADDAGRPPPRVDDPTRRVAGGGQL